MFKTLAEYTMRGRWQAITVVLIGSLVPFVPQAAVALVTMRKGASEGFILMMCAILPGVVGFWLGDIATPLVAVSIIVVAVGYVLALFLRELPNWSYVFALAVIVSSLSSLFLNVILGDMSETLRNFYSEAMKGPDGMVSDEVNEMIGLWTTSSINTLIAVFIAYSPVVGLAMGRWWQAMLFNAGGFQGEFHGLRLPPWLAGICLIAVIFAVSGEKAAQDRLIWPIVLCLPLLFAGLGLMHWLIARFKLGVIAVVALYMALLYGIFAPIVMILAALDAAIDIRQKFRIDQPGG